MRHCLQGEFVARSEKVSFFLEEAANPESAKDSVRYRSQSRRSQTAAHSWPCLVDQEIFNIELLKDQQNEWCHHRRRCRAPFSEN